eukprot:3904357-Prymnesium_polylepis.1
MRSGAPRNPAKWGCRALFESALIQSSLEGTAALAPSATGKTCRPGCHAHGQAKIFARGPVRSPGCRALRALLILWRCAADEPGTARERIVRIDVPRLKLGRGSRRDEDPAAWRCGEAVLHVAVCRELDAWRRVAVKERHVLKMDVSAVDLP